MGGNLGGPINLEFNNDTMEFDFVRVYQESNLSASEKVKSNMHFYPNPVDNIINIELPHFNNENIEMQVIDIHGRVINKKQYFIDSFKIN